MCSPIQQCDEKGVFGGGIVGAVAVDVVVAIVGADVGSCFRFFLFSPRYKVSSLCESEGNTPHVVYH